MKKMISILTTLFCFSAFAGDLYESKIELTVKYRDFQFGFKDDFTIWSGKLLMSDDSRYCQLIPDNEKMLPLSCKGLQFNVCTQTHKQGDHNICVHASSRIELLNREILKNVETLQDGYRHRRSLDIMKAYFEVAHCSIPIGAAIGWCEPSTEVNTYNIHLSWPNLAKEQEFSDSFKKGSTTYDLSEYGAHNESLKFSLNTTNFKRVE